MNVAFFLRPKFNVTYIYENDSIRAGLEKMKYHGYTAIPVINDKNEYVGTVSEGDFLWYLVDEQKENLQKANDYISQMLLEEQTLQIVNELYNLIKPYDNGYTDEDYKNAEGEECLHERGRFIIDYNKYIFVQIDSDPHRLGTYIVTFHNYNNGEVKNIYVNERDYFEIQDILKDKGFERIDLK